MSGLLFMVSFDAAGRRYFFVHHKGTKGFFDFFIMVCGSNANVLPMQCWEVIESHQFATVFRSIGGYHRIYGEKSNILVGLWACVVNSSSKCNTSTIKRWHRKNLINLDCHSLISGSNDALYLFNMIRTLLKGDKRTPKHIFKLCWILFMMLL